MSFILDALKKSENDRQRQAAPALFEVKVAAPRRKFPIWAAGLAILFGVNVFALGWVLLRDSGAAAPAAPAPAPAGPAVQPAATGAPPGMITVPATVTIPTTVNIPVSAAPSVTVGSADRALDGPFVEEPVLSGSGTPVPPDYNANDYAPAITPAEADVLAAARRAGGMPSRDEVIAQGVQIPELRLDLHVYAVNPADRFVFINMRKLREGDSLPEGVRVESITQTGAQLWYRGTRFSLDGN